MSDVSLLPAGPEYREVPDCPGYMAGSDGTIWSCWTRGRWPKRTGDWQLAPRRREKKAGAHFAVLLRTAAGFRVTEFVHRVILTTFVGPCPDGMISCHDPDHDPANNAVNNLRWATPTDNMEDCHRHGRRVCGSKSYNATITEADVEEMFNLRRSGLTHAAIAAKFGVRQQTVTRVLTRQRWRHVVVADTSQAGEKVQTNHARGGRHPLAKMTESSVLEMKRLRREGWTQKRLAEKYGVSQGTISDILTGKIWTHTE